MEKHVGKIFTGERALFCSNDLEIADSIFENGESPLKESKNISLNGCMFKWKYPLWYCENITTDKTSWFAGARAGVWYSNNISVCDAVIEAPKNFRRCNGLTLRNVTFTNAAETLWHCSNTALYNVSASGSYFAMNSSDLTAEGLNLSGDYSFDGVQNATLKNCKLLSKDAFWNSKNITVYDSFISGEYLGWNAEDLTLVRCTIESLQGLCYIKNLKLIDCKLINTTLAFEYSTVDATIVGNIDSVLNPSGGRISAAHIGKLIIEKDKVDPDKTIVVCTEGV